MRRLDEIDKEIRALARIRDLGRLRGEQRPLPRRIDELLDERFALTATGECS